MMTRPVSVPDLNARDLHALVTIAHLGSLTDAASFLHTSQSGLSRTVTRIERLVGVQLFDRNTRRLQPTPTGSEFVAMSERVLGDLQIAMRGLRDAARGHSGQVIVSTFPLILHHTLPMLVRTFRDQRPHVEVQIRTGRNSEIIDNVVNGLADFGITFGGSVPDGVVSVEVRREPLYVIIPRAHPLAHSARPIRLAQLRNVSSVSPPRGHHVRLLVDGAAVGAGFTLRHSVIVSGLTEVVAHVRAGVGVGVLPRWAFPDPVPGDIRARLLSSPGLSAPITMIRLADRFMSPAAKSFWTLLLHRLRLHDSSQTTRVVELRRGSGGERCGD